MKPIIFSRLFILIMICSILTLAGCSITNPNRIPREFTLRNNTGDDIRHVYLKFPGSLIWGDSVIFSPIANATQRAISVPEDCYDTLFRMDIKVVTTDGVFYTKLSHIVTNKSTVTFHLSDLDDESPRAYTVENVTGSGVRYIYIKAPDSPFWGSSHIFSAMSNASARTIIIPRENMCSEHKADMRLQTTTGAMYTIYNRTISHRGTITVRGGDLDDDSPREFTLGNVTGDDIRYVYIKDPTSFFWGESLIFSTLSDASTRTLQVDRDKMDDEFRADIRIQTTSGITYSKNAHEIIHQGAINFHVTDLDPASPRTITIGNITDDAIRYIYIKHPQSQMWGDSFIYSSFASGSTRTLTIPRNLMDDEYRADIRLQATNGNQYTKEQQAILHRGTIMFFHEDIDS